MAQRISNGALNRTLFLYLRCPHDIENVIPERRSRRGNQSDRDVAAAHVGNMKKFRWIDQQNAVPIADDKTMMSAQRRRSAVLG